MVFFIGAHFIALASIPILEGSPYCLKNETLLTVGRERRMNENLSTILIETGPI
jgi:hypothetical protein